MSDTVQPLLNSGDEDAGCMEVVEKPSTSINDDGGEAARAIKVDEGEATDDVDIDIDPGMYTAVLLASLGYLKCDFDSSVKGTMHAFPLLLCCGPLCFLQVLVGLVLQKDLDLERKWRKPDSPESSADLELVMLKILMVMVVFMSLFSYFAITCRLLLLAVNPLTWIEIACPPDRTRDIIEMTPCQQWVKFALRPGFQAPCAIFALVLRGIVGYLVCTVSVSLILDSDGTADVIFNCLAMTFLLELNGLWWVFFKSAMHLYSEDDFKLKVNKKVWKEDRSTLQEKVVDATAFPGVTMGVLEWSTKRPWCCRKEKGNQPWMKRTVIYSRFEAFVTYLALLFMYGRQFQVVLHAYDTGILPAARDLCTTMRVWRRLEEWLIGGTRSGLDFMGHHQLLGECHMQGRFMRLTWEDQIDLWNKYWQAHVIVLVAGFFLLVVPHFFYYIVALIFKKAKDEDDENKGNNEKEAAWKAAQPTLDEIRRLTQKLDDATVVLGRQLKMPQGTSLAAMLGKLAELHEARPAQARTHPALLGGSRGPSSRDLKCTPRGEEGIFRRSSSNLVASASGVPAAEDLESAA